MTANIVEPGSGEVMGRVGMASKEDIAEASKSAAEAQKSWADTLYEQRATVLRNAAQIMETNRQEIAEWLVHESGSIRPKAESEVAITIKCLYEASAMPSQAHGLVLPAATGRISIARRRPIGVVGVIAPFNFPLYLAARAIAPALAVGNAVVLKPDPRTAVSGGLVLARVFQLAGLPQDVLHVLPGTGLEGHALCSNEHVGMIQFTGSTQTGRAVGEVAGRHLKKISLELGGKNSLIILDDADLDLAVTNAAWGTFAHQGQICMSVGRILVQASIAEAFVERLADKARGLPAGDPVSGQVALGPLIDERQADRVSRIVAASVAQGARLLAGGKQHGRVFEATVLAEVRSGMPAFDEEIFGPVAAVSVFHDDDEAVRLANDTSFGLAAGIITASIRRAMQIGEQLRVGHLHVNDQTVNEDAVNPFGGVGISGNGSRIGGPANWEEFTQWQWTTIRGEAPKYPF